MADERIATIIITTGVVVLMAVTIAFAASGADPFPPSARDLPVISTDPAHNTSRAGVTARETGGAGSTKATSPTGVASTEASPSPAGGVAGAGGRTSSGAGKPGASSGKSDSHTKPDKDHEVVKPPVRESDDENKVKTPKPAD